MKHVKKKPVITSSAKVSKVLPKKDGDPKKKVKGKKC